MKFTSLFFLLLIVCIPLTAQTGAYWETESPDGRYSLSIPAWWYVSMEENFVTITNSSEYVGAYTVDSGIASIIISLTEADESDAAFHHSVVKRDTQYDPLLTPYNTHELLIGTSRCFLTLGRYDYFTDICLITTRYSGYFVTFEGIVRSGEMENFGDTFLDIFYSLKLNIP